jgi:hypothetical protein
MYSLNHDLKSASFSQWGDLKSIYINMKFETLMIKGAICRVPHSCKVAFEHYIFSQVNISMYKTLQQCILDKKMNFDNVTEIFKFGCKEYPNIHMEEVNSVRQWQRYTVSSAQTPSLSWHTYKVDANVHRSDGWAFGSTFSCLCLFHSWYKPRCFWVTMNGPNQGTKDVVRRPEWCHAWWIWWPLVRILHSYLGIRCGRRGHLTSVCQQFPPRSTS